MLYEGHLEVTLILEKIVAEKTAPEKKKFVIKNCRFLIHIAELRSEII